MALVRTATSPSKGHFLGACPWPEDFAAAAQLVSTNQFEAIKDIEQERHQRAELAVANGKSLEDARTPTST